MFTAGSFASFQLVEHGAVVRAFHPVLYATTGYPTGEPLDEEDDLPFGTVASTVAGIALVNRLTGHDLAPESLGSTGARRGIGYRP